MAEYNNLLLENNNGILTITINRAEKLNALNIATIEELRAVFQGVYDDEQVKSVILTGAGEKAFVAGADISEISELNEMNGRKFAESGQEVFALIEKCHKPVIAAVNGFALGGGCELAMACHFRIATPNAKFGQPEVNLGIIPGYGGTQRLPQLIGKGKALELMMTADFIAAEEAKQLGLVNHIADSHEALLEMANNLLNKINSKAPLAIGMVIESVNAHYATEENGYQTEANSFASCCKSEDFKEGTKAFLEKRAAEFKGE
jgi:enoyl-CoA hydratase